MFVLMIWSSNLNGNVRGNHYTREFESLEAAKEAAEAEYQAGNQTSIFDSWEAYQASWEE